MIISSILNREKLTISSTINILWTPINSRFEHFILDLGTNLVSLNQLYYGNNLPHLIICNNKIDYYHQCYNISRQFHLPVLLIEHSIKSELFDDNKIKLFDNFPCVHHLSVDQQIANSWNLKNIQVLPYNLNNEDNKKIWKNLIYQTSKKIFSL